MSTANNAEAETGRAQAQRIRELNDAFRRSFCGGRVMLTASLAELLEPERGMILKKVQEFADFDIDNDPHGEHDFGSFEHGGVRYIWKIEYFDLQFECGSENPADPSITTRVLTVMRADEY
jgi:hypothetical protein